MELNKKIVLTSINDLKNLSYISNKSKRKKMLKWVNLLTKNYESYKKTFLLVKQIKKEYEQLKDVVDQNSYKQKKILFKNIAIAENNLIIEKSKLSNFINKLLYAHNCKSKNKRGMTALELYDIVIAYENNNFKDNYFPRNRLRLITKNNTCYWNLKFQLYICTQVISGKLKWKINLNKNDDFWKKQKKILEKKIKICNDRKNTLYDTFLSMQYAKLIKKFDKKAHKFDKKKDKININSEYVIDFENLTKYYYNKWIATKILKGFDLKIKQGEFVVILGPSGSGKTTLLNIMSGMDKATYGKTIVNNCNLIKMNDSQLTKFRKENIGYIFQQYGLLPNLTVKENIEIGWNLQTNKQKRLNIDDLLKTVGMFEHANKFPHELSGGQQQRVSVARSMAKNPAIIFGDEPTGAVDEEMSKQILQLFVDINKKFNTTIIIVTHNQIIADLATRVIKVNSGNIIQNYINKKPKNVNQLDWSKN